MSLFGLPGGGAPLRLQATAAFGLEAVVAAELRELGFTDARTANGRVSFSAGGERDLARCNLWLRAADRVLVELAEFPAPDADALFEGVRAIPWADFLPANPRVTVTAATRDSALASSSASQATVKKAIVETLKRRHGQSWIEETGASYAVALHLEQDRALVTLDSTGEGLHRRGYRLQAGEAPLRETLAAALVLLSRWSPPRPLADPCCGSGTIAIEAAWQATRTAPGLLRSFAAESWAHSAAKLWREARQEARLARRGPEAMGGTSIMASDRDPVVLQAARENARRAGVAPCIEFRVQPLESFRCALPRGCLICNPPYGQRSGELAAVESLYRRMGEVFAQLPEWSVFVITSHPGFERLYGRPATKNRKLYNGRIRTYLHQYFGPLP